MHPPMTHNDIAEAAKLVSDAALVAAERVATAAAKAAVESAASAVSAASSASQMLAAVAVSRLDGLDKTFSSHEKLDEGRFDAVMESQRELKKDLKSDITDLKDDIKEVTVDLKKQTKVLALIMGGLIVLSHIPDVIAMLHH